MVASLLYSFPSGARVNPALLDPRPVNVASFAMGVQGVLVLLLPIMLAILPSEGAVRTVVLRPVPLHALINAIVAADGRIVTARADGGLIVTGRRDRLALALLPLGIVALPAMAAGCYTGREG